MGNGRTPGKLSGEFDVLPELSLIRFRTPEWLVGTWSKLR